MRICSRYSSVCCWRPPAARADRTAGSPSWPQDASMPANVACTDLPRLRRRPSRRSASSRPAHAATRHSALASRRHRRPQRRHAAGASPSASAISRGASRQPRTGRARCRAKIVVRPNLGLADGGRRGRALRAGARSITPAIAVDAGDYLEPFVEPVLPGKAPPASRRTDFSTLGKRARLASIAVRRSAPAIFSPSIAARRKASRTGTRVAFYRDRMQRHAAGRRWAPASWSRCRRTRRRSCSTRARDPGHQRRLLRRQGRLAACSEQERANDQ